MKSQAKLTWLGTQGWICAMYGYGITLNGYSKWAHKKTTFFSYYLHKCSTVDIGVFGSIDVG